MLLLQDLHDTYMVLFQPICRAYLFKQFAKHIYHLILLVVDEVLSWSWSWTAKSLFRSWFTKSWSPPCLNGIPYSLGLGLGLGLGLDLGLDLGSFSINYITVVC